MWASRASASTSSGFAYSRSIRSRTRRSRARSLSRWSVGLLVIAKIVPHAPRKRDEASPGSWATRVTEASGELVREIGEALVAVLRDEHDVLEPAAAETLAIEGGLDGDHVAGDELVAEATEVG